MNGDIGTKWCSSQFDQNNGMQNVYTAIKLRDSAVGFRMYTAGMVEGKYNAICGFRIYVTDDAAIMSAGKQKFYINTSVWPIPAGIVLDAGEAYYNEIIGMVDRDQVVTGESFHTEDGAVTAKYLVSEITANCDANLPCS